MPSHSLAKLTIDDLDIIGYSVSGEETVVGMPQLDVCFDIGKAPGQVIPINHVLLTHGHMDHAAGIAYYLSNRHFNDQSPGTILAPENCIPPIRDIVDAWGRLDGNRIPCKLVGVKPGDEYPVKPNMVARVFPTRHVRGSVGFSIIEKRKKLKPEYLKLTGPQIVELKRQNIPIDDPVELPIVSYFGDTKFVDYSQLEYIRKCRILIIECTFFLDEHQDRADAGHHLHIGEFAEVVEKMECEHIIVTHLTKRTPMRDVRDIFKKHLSPATYDKIKLLMEARRSY